MTEVTISICITTYNVQNYIKKSIDSVLSQQLPSNFEIVISDDASTDDTIKIIENYKKLYPQNFIILYSSVNKGLVENTMKALKTAKGKFIALLDADDYWFTNDKIKKQIDILKNDLEAGFVYTNFRYVDESNTTGKILGISSDFIPPAKNNYYEYLLNPYICPSTICFRASLLDQKKMDYYVSRKFAAQDYALFLDFTQQSKGIYLNEITTNYTVRKGSLSRQEDIKKKIDNHSNCFEIGSSFIKTHPIPEKLNNLRTFRFKLKVLLTSWESNDIDLIREKARQLRILEFLRYNPKAIYIYLASQNKLLYKLMKPWVLRKRPPGK